MHVGWVRSVGVYRRPGEVGKRDMFSVVIICIMDFYFYIFLNQVALILFLHVVFKLIRLCS